MSLIGSYFEEIKLPERSRDFDLIAFQTIARTLEARINMNAIKLEDVSPYYIQNEKPDAKPGTLWIVYDN